MAGFMGTISLLDMAGRVMSSTNVGETGQSIWQGFKTGLTAVINNVPHSQVVASSGTGDEEETDVGYVEDDVLEQLTVSTVSIPANFAGLEAVMVPTRLMWQLFEITEVVEGDGYVDVTAMHIFYRQLSNYTLWTPNENTRYSGAAACRAIMGNALFDQGFRVASDCTDLIYGSEFDFDRTNIVEAFLNPESGICAKYGMSLIRNNDVFYCLKDVGYDRGFVIQNRKNMLGVERTENTENVITRVAPVAKDEDGNYVWLNYNGSKWIDSPHINDYASPKAEILYTDLEIGEDDVTWDNIQAKLRAAAQKRFDEDEVDIPEVTMTVEFVSLGDTEEYSQYRNLDKVYLYDIIHIIDTDRGYNYSAQVISVEHNILTGMLESVTIGTPKLGDAGRKISTWQVPEVTGKKIRSKSIGSGSFAPDSIHSDDITDGAVKAKHFSTSADDHVQGIVDESISSVVIPTINGKAPMIYIGSSDNTWGKIWAKINTLGSGDTATIYINNAAISALTGGLISNNIHSGTITKIDSSSFAFELVNASSAQHVNLTITNASSSSSGNCVANNPDDRFGKTYGSTTDPISDLLNIPVNSEGICVLKSTVAPSGASSVALPYICYGISGTRVVIISRPSTQRTWINYYVSDAWAGWKEISCV